MQTRAIVNKGMQVKEEPRQGTYERAYPPFRNKAAHNQKT